MLGEMSTEVIFSQGADYLEEFSPDYLPTNIT